MDNAEPDLCRAQRGGKGKRQTNPVWSRLVTIQLEFDGRASRLASRSRSLVRNMPVFQSDRSIPNTPVSILAPRWMWDSPCHLLGGLSYRFSLFETWRNKYCVQVRCRRRDRADSTLRNWRPSDSSCRSGHSRFGRNAHFQGFACPSFPRHYFGRLGIRSACINHLRPGLSFFEQRRPMVKEPWRASVLRSRGYAVRGIELAKRKGRSRSTKLCTGRYWRSLLLFGGKKAERSLGQAG